MLILFVIYVIGFILSYIIMSKLFKQGDLSDFAFKCHIIFLSLIWFINIPAMLAALIIGPVIFSIFIWMLFIVIQPKQTWKDTKMIFASIKRRFN